tara:strand:- start:1 stop:426 length:426 start_codon:yes stop_codon:yes gene_type:complete
MNYQSIRSIFETKLKTAYGSLTPAIPVFFDNYSNAMSDAIDEFINVNIQFGETTQSSLTQSFDEVKGIVVVRAFSEKGKGPSRNQVLINTSFDVIETINSTGKPNSGVYVRTGVINGPTFQVDRPYFISRLETNFQATVIS